MNSPTGSQATLDIDPAEYYNIPPSIHAFQPIYAKSEAYQGAPAPFVRKQRYQAVWIERTPAGDIMWASPNALAPGPMPSPTKAGPVSCTCEAHGQPRYGFRLDDAWTVYADWYQEPEGERACGPYIPSIFHGKSACAEKDVPHILRQWDATWVERVEGGFCFRESFVSDVKRDLFDTDEQLREVLHVTEERLPIIDKMPGVVRDAQDLRTWWCSLAHHSLIRFGLLFQLLIGGGEWKRVARERPDLHATLTDDLYIFGPRGVWVNDTRNRIAEIQEFVATGVPVFFRWEAAFANLPGAAGIAPPGRSWSSLMPHTALPPHVPATPTRPTGPRTPPPCGRCTGNHSTPACPQAPRSAVASSAPRAAHHSPPTPPENTQAKKVKKRVSFSKSGDSDDIDFDVDFDSLKSPRHDKNSAGFSVPNDMEAVAPVWVAIDSAPNSPTPTDPFGLDFIPIVEAEDYRDPPVAVIARIDGTLPCVDRRDPAPERPNAGAWIYDVGLAMSALRNAADRGAKLRNKREVIRFALKYGLRFNTPIRVQDPQPSMPLETHVLPEQWLIRDYYSDRDKVAVWDAGVKGLILRPHALRAALMRGGIIARIARDALPGFASFSLGPTTAVVDYGVPTLYRLAWNGENIGYHDDYLNQAELRLLLGQFEDSTRQVGNSGYETLSFWPDDTALATMGYAHVWSETWEIWYRERRAALHNGSTGALSAAAWKKGVHRAVGDRDARTRGN